MNCVIQFTFQLITKFNSFVFSKYFFYIVYCTYIFRSRKYSPFNSLLLIKSIYNMVTIKECICYSFNIIIKISSIISSSTNKQFINHFRFEFFNCFTPFFSSHMMGFIKNICIEAIQIFVVKIEIMIRNNRKVFCIIFFIYFIPFIFQRFIWYNDHGIEIKISKQFSNYIRLTNTGSCDYTTFFMSFKHFLYSFISFLIVFFKHICIPFCFSISIL